MSLKTIGLVLIIVGAVTGVSISALFTGGLLPAGLFDAVYFDPELDLRRIEINHELPDTELATEFAILKLPSFQARP